MFCRQLSIPLKSHTISKGVHTADWRASPSDPLQQQAPYHDEGCEYSVPSTTDQIILIPLLGIFKNNCKWCWRYSLQNFIEEKWLTAISKLITSWALLSALSPGGEGVWSICHHY